MSLRAGAAVLAVIGLMAASACGDDTRPLSEQSGSLSPGRYVTDQFELALSFKVGKGWEVSELRQKPYLEILHEYENGSYFVAISFNNPPGKVSDPRKPDRLVPAPENWVYWFQKHPYLKTSSPKPVSVGGVEGRRFDTRVFPLPGDYYSEDCLGQGVPLWPLRAGHHWCADEGYTSRTIVLNGGEGKTLILDVWSDSKKFEKVLPDSQEVLKTVEWKDAP